MSIAIIAKYFIDLKSAEDYAKKQGEIHKAEFVILQADSAYFVVSERQIWKS